MRKKHSRNTYRTLAKYVENTHEYIKKPARNSLQKTQKIRKKHACTKYVRNTHEIRHETQLKKHDLEKISLCVYTYDVFSLRVALWRPITQKLKIGKI